MEALKLFLVLFIFNNYFHHAFSKSVVTDLSDVSEDKALFDAFSEILASSEPDKIVTRSAEEITFTNEEIQEVIDILLKSNPEAAAYLTVDVVSSKVKDVSPSSKYLIKYIFDGIRGIDRQVDEKHLKSVILEVLAEKSTLAASIKNEFQPSYGGVGPGEINPAANVNGVEVASAANANDVGSAAAISAARALDARVSSNLISERSVAKVLEHLKQSGLFKGAALGSARAPALITQQLNSLQPIARFVTGNLINKFINKGIPTGIVSRAQLGASFPIPSVGTASDAIQQEASDDGSVLLDEGNAAASDGRDLLASAEQSVAASNAQELSSNSEENAQELSSNSEENAGPLNDDVASDAQMNAASNSDVAVQDGPVNNEVNAAIMKLYDVVNNLIKSGRKLQELSQKDNGEQNVGISETAGALQVGSKMGKNGKRCFFKKRKCKKKKCNLGIKFPMFPQFPLFPQKPQFPPFPQNPQFPQFPQKPQFPPFPQNPQFPPFPQKPQFPPTIAKESYVYFFFYPCARVRKILCCTQSNKPCNHTCV